MAIAIGVIMMLVAFATGIGLQEKIREKMSAFTGHITISSYDNNNSQVSLMPISKDQDFYPEFTGVDGIEHIQATAYIGGVIRTATDFEGIIVKGIGTDYNWDYFKEFLIEGELPDLSGSLNDEILMSAYTANRLGLEVGDKAVTYFLRDESSKTPLTRAFVIKGIYNSGFQDFDELYILADIRHIQRLNRWEKDQVGNFDCLLYTSPSPRDS